MTKSRNKTVLFCKKCMSKVEEGDTFCTNCLSRLDQEGAVLSKYEYSKFLGTMDVKFNADAVVGESNISGFEVMDCRLSEKIVSLCGSDYYRAVYKKAEEQKETVIRHIRFPQYMDRDVCALMHRIDYQETDRLCEQFSKQVPDEVMAFQARCVNAGIESINHSAISLYSELYNCYHIFIMMDECVPFVNYIQKEKLTLRDVISIGISLSEQLLRLQQQGTNYGSFSDLSIYIGKDGKPCLDCKLLDLYERFYPFTSIAIYRRSFVSPMNANFEAYSLAMLLYKLLSGFNNPYINPYVSQISSEALIRAEEKRMMAEQPVLPEKAQNMAGKKIVDALCDSKHAVTLEELHNVLENSFNYISAGELNQFINE